MTPSMRRFVGIDLGREPVPDETTILNFRHLLERHDLGKALFERVNEHLASQGLKVAGGTIADATIITAPSSTKNEAKARDPETHQTRKGQRWYFGIGLRSEPMLHIGVDSKTKLIHSMTTTAANVHDAKVLGDLLHGNETRVYGDQAYRGQATMICACAPNAKDFTNRRYRHRGVVDGVERGKNRTKSGVRAKVEHPFGAIKRVFGFAKVRYRGLAKNTQRLWVSCGLVNLFVVRHLLLRARQQPCMRRASVEPRTGRIRLPVYAASRGWSVRDCRARLVVAPTPAGIGLFRGSLSEGS